MTADATTAAQTAARLTHAQRAALADCIAQDPTGERTKLPGGRSRALPVHCDARSRGSLAESGCLGWSDGFDDSNTVTAFGREVAAIIRRKA